MDNWILLLDDWPLVLSQGEEEFFYGDHQRWLASLMDAISKNDEAIDLDPNDSNAFGDRGVSYWMLAQSERAFHDLDEAIRVGPQNAYALVAGAPSTP